MTDRVVQSRCNEVITQVGDTGVSVVLYDKETDLEDLEG